MSALKKINTITLLLFIFFILNILNADLSPRGAGASPGDLVVKMTTVPDIGVTDSIAPHNDKSLPFGSIPVGGSAEQTVTVTNKGNADLLIGTITSPASPFRIPANLDNCSGQSLSPGARCTLKVRFEANTSGAFNGAFDIPSNDPDANTTRMNVSGTRLPSFTNNRPSAPTLVFPLEGETVSGPGVSFGYNRSSDPDGDSIGYTITVCEDANLSLGCITNQLVASAKNKGVNYAGFGLGFALVFGSILIGRSKGRRKTGFLISLMMVSGLLFVSCGSVEDKSGGGNPGADIIHTVRGLTRGQSYHWQVVADDGFGGTAHSENRSFSTL